MTVSISVPLLLLRPPISPPSLLRFLLFCFLAPLPPRILLTWLTPPVEAGTGTGGAASGAAGGGGLSPILKAGPRGWEPWCARECVPHFRCRLRAAVTMNAATTRFMYSRLQKVGIWIWVVLCWCSFFSRFRGWMIVIFQLSGFYCNYRPHDNHERPSNYNSRICVGSRSTASMHPTRSLEMPRIVVAFALTRRVQELRVTAVRAQGKQPVGTQTLNHGILKGREAKGEGYLRHLGEPREPKRTRESWGVLSHLPPLEPPPLKVPELKVFTLVLQPPRNKKFKLVQRGETRMPKKNEVIPLV